MAKKVTFIPAGRDSAVQKRKVRVGAYIRVSTGTKAQIASFVKQINYYTELIQSNPEWEFAGIYADEAVSGTKVDRREEFQMLIQECEDGNIDLIITKTVTRFGRNTVEAIQAIRRLKELGIGVYFESQNINTLTEKSELLITILASVAQSESEDFSGNNKWAVKKRFQDGTFIISTPAYGYRNDENGKLIMKQDEIQVVAMIYRLYLNGWGFYKIAQKLNEDGIPTVRSAKYWSGDVIGDILKNPIYQGDMLLQKTITTNTFPFTRKTNAGEAEQYLITDNHSAIVSREEAQAVKEIMKYRTDLVNAGGEKAKNRYLFSGKIVCAECGKHLRRQKVYIGKPYERIIWACNNHILNKELCEMKAIREEELQNAFIVMWNKLYTNQGLILEPLLQELKRLPLSSVDTKEIEQLDHEIRDLTEQCRILNQIMEKGYIDNALFYEEQNQLVYRLSESRRRKNVLLSKRRSRKEIIKTEQLIRLLRERKGLLYEFDEELFGLVVNEMEVTKEHKIIFCLHNGLRLEEENSVEERGR